MYKPIKNPIDFIKSVGFFVALLNIRDKWFFSCKDNSKFNNFYNRQNQKCTSAKPKVQNKTVQIQLHGSLMKNQFLFQWV